MKAMAGHIAARIRHPDGAALGAAFGFVRKNVSNNRRLNPGSSIKQDVNRYGPPSCYFIS